MQEGRILLAVYAHKDLQKGCIYRAVSGILPHKAALGTDCLIFRPHLARSVWLFRQPWQHSAPLGLAVLCLTPLAWSASLSVSVFGRQM